MADQPGSVADEGHNGLDLDSPQVFFRHSPCCLSDLDRKSVRSTPLPGCCLRKSMNLFVYP